MFCYCLLHDRLHSMHAKRCTDSVLASLVARIDIPRLIIILNGLMSSDLYAATLQSVYTIDAARLGNDKNCIRSPAAHINHLHSDGAYWRFFGLFGSVLNQWIWLVIYAFDCPILKEVHSYHCLTHQCCVATIDWTIAWTPFRPPDFRSPKQFVSGVSAIPDRRYYSFNKGNNKHVDSVIETAYPRGICITNESWLFYGSIHNNLQYPFALFW